MGSCLNVVVEIQTFSRKTKSLTAYTLDAAYYLLCNEVARHCVEYQKLKDIINITGYTIIIVTTNMRQTDTAQKTNKAHSQKRDHRHSEQS